MHRINVPGDNSCFFHAVGIHVKLTASELRKLCAYLAQKYKTKLINDLSIETWILFSGFGSINEYQRLVLQKHYWGGAIEMLLLSDYFQRPFAVYQYISSKEAKKIAVFNEYGPTKPVFLLYSNNNHYDCLIKK